MTGTSRDIGLDGAGKGSRPRNCGSKAFNQNYDEIDFHRYSKWILGFKRTGNKLRKTYR